MTNESLEQRARELLEAEYVRSAQTTRAAAIRAGWNLDAAEACAVRAIIRALESTPAQVKVVVTQEMLDSADEAFADVYDGVSNNRRAAIANALCAALSARTAPAEGDGHFFTSAVIDLRNRSENRATEEIAIDMRADNKRPATTAPVVGDVELAASAWLEETAKRLGVHTDGNSVFFNARAVTHWIDTARLAKAEGDAP